MRVRLAYLKFLERERDQVGHFRLSSHPERVVDYFRGYESSNRAVRRRRRPHVGWSQTTKFVLISRFGFVRHDASGKMGGRFGGGRGGSRGGMRGRKQQNGSFKIHNGSKLRPAPEKPFLDATETSRVVKGKGKGKGKLVPIDQEQPDEEEEDMEEFGYREDLRPERRPLEGVVLCVTGATEVKSALLLEAKELGATTSKTLSIETTHLVATVAGSAKYEVRPSSSRGVLVADQAHLEQMAVLHKMKIVLPTWISAVGEAWRGAKDIDLAGVSPCSVAQSLCADSPLVGSSKPSI